MSETRKFRPRQKGLECKIEGCTEWRVSNDLCPKHNMAEHRKTEGGKAYVREYNKRYKRPDIQKVCENEKCGKDFVTARKNQVFCSDCSTPYNAQKRHRAKHPKKVRARGVINKRIERGSVEKEFCDACGDPAESHHHNYDEPLDVVWLCKKHHNLLESF